MSDDERRKLADDALAALASIEAEAAYLAIRDGDRLVLRSLHARPVPPATVTAAARYAPQLHAVADAEQHVANLAAELTR